MTSAAPLRKPSCPAIYIVIGERVKQGNLFNDAPIADGAPVGVRSATTVWEMSRP
jgi:hypothetical protein